MGTGTDIDIPIIRIILLCLHGLSSITQIVTCEHEFCSGFYQKINGFVYSLATAMATILHMVVFELLFHKVRANRKYLENQLSTFKRHQNIIDLKNNLRLCMSSHAKLIASLEKTDKSLKTTVSVEAHRLTYNLIYHAMFLVDKL